MTVVAPRGAPLIGKLKLSVPPGLRLRSTSSVSLVTNPGPLSYEDSTHKGSLSITLDKPAKLCQVIMSAPSLAGALRRRPRTSRSPGPAVTVSVDDNNRGSSDLTAKLSGG